MPLRHSEGIILSVAKTTLQTLRDLIAQLSEFGLDTAVADQFDADITAAEAMPTDLHNRISLRQLTSDKEEALNACWQWGRKLRTRLQLAFGANSPQSKSFPSKEFSDSANSENNMMSVMKVLTALAETHKDVLANFGQTPEILAEGSVLLDDLRGADAVQEQQKDSKRVATEERHQVFQKLYDTVNRINKVGRIVFQDDPANRSRFDSKWPGRGGQSDTDESEPL